MCSLCLFTVSKESGSDSLIYFNYGPVLLYLHNMKPFFHKCGPPKRRVPSNVIYHFPIEPLCSFSASLCHQKVNNETETTLRGLREMLMLCCSAAMLRYRL